MSIKIEKNITIYEERKIIFDFTQDYNHRLAWDTFLNKAELINAKSPRKGAKSWCVSKYGLGMETEYVSFNPPKVTAITQSKPSLLFKNFSGSWRFEELSENKTEVYFTYSFVLNFPFRLVQKLIKSILKNNVKQRLIGLKVSIERDKLNLEK